MKSVAIQHIEAIFRLKVEQQKRLKRTIHLSFIADEELGGVDGMAKYIISREFKDLNIGLAIDEGLASPDEIIPLFYGERSVLMVKFKCMGNTGHGSQFVEKTAAEKVQKIINNLLGLREEQRAIYESDPAINLGDVTTVNLTMMEGGVLLNVVPNMFTIAFDIRMTPTVDIVAFENQLRRWMEEAGGGIDLLIEHKFNNQKMTSVSKEDPWFQAFTRATDKHQLKIAPRIFPAGTDSRFIREIGIPAFGFSPMNFTPVLLHDHNEFLNEKIFLKGIDIFCDVIEEIASV